MGETCLQFVDPKRQDSHLERLRKEKVLVVSAELRVKLEQWRNPRTFLFPESSVGSLGMNDNIARRNSEQNAKSIYLELKRTDTRGAKDIDNVRARILAVALSDMRDHWLMETPHLNLRPNDKAKLERHFQIHADDWEEQLGRRFRIGSRLRALAIDDIGGLGALLVIPGSWLRFS